MGRLDLLVTVIEETLSTKRRRHIVSGILSSISLLFGGLAVTVMTLKMED